MAATNEGFSHILKIDMTEVQKSSSSSITDLSKFEIEVQAKFIIMQKYGDVEDDMFAEEGRFYSHVMYEFSREYLIGDGYGAVLDMLKSHLRVPIEPAIVEKLAARVANLATTAPDGGDRVSGMKVEIVAVLSSLPDFTNNDDDSDEEDEGLMTEEEEEDINVADEEDEGLMTEVVEAAGKDCSICLGELTGEGHHGQLDRICEIPDEVLVSILSLIPMKEAARTSVLSRRWEKLWTLCSRLHFDGSKRLPYLLTPHWEIEEMVIEHNLKAMSKRERLNIWEKVWEQVRHMERVDYINWVNHISWNPVMIYKLLMNSKFGLISLMIHIEMTSMDGSCLHLKGKLRDLNCPCQSIYTKTITVLLRSFPSPQITCISHLTSLILKHVDIPDQVLENFISNCPFLECLCVVNSESLIHPRVLADSGSSSPSSLKYVEITYCPNLESLELNSVNLLSLKYEGPKIEISFDNIPNLVELYMKEELPYFTRTTLPLLSTSNNFSQLQRSLHSIKQLELHATVYSTDNSLLGYTALIKACPSLIRLALELTSLNCKKREKFHSKFATFGMAKFARKLTPCSFNKQKGELHLHDADHEDRISELPDEVLVAILSLIPMEEAVRSSVLSRRWEKLWTLCSRLDLDASKRLLNLLKQLKAIEEDMFIEREIMKNEKIWVRICEKLRHKRVDYINWVNHILESCSTPNNLQAIDEFRVGFDLDDEYRDDIDGWVRFAFEKEVKRFELSLSEDIDESYYCNKENSYRLLLQSFPSPQITCISHLTSLKLKHVNIRDQVLENLISHCPFLECLCVVASESLIHPRVLADSSSPSSSSSLKYVEITNCSNVQSLQLNAVNLLSLKYEGPKIEISFDNIPNLVELYIGKGELPYFVRKTLPLLSTSNNFSQLQKLAVGISLFVETKYSAQCTDDSLLGYTALIKACPSLIRLALEEEKRPKNEPHHSLKLVQVTGFVGQTIDIEFCRYLIKNAIMLDKIIINPRYLLRKGTEDEDSYAEKVKAARERAKLFGSKYCLGDKLVIV
ncbi:hypothetical protein CCACVL1_28590 [Corchorus capsularis]|uniref:F-box domain-containing protein n=1 Tax=Corchorus capsularis TaxID=210143 RepID=A0A1R3G615_COCAP|nr:hypothetical protein CCACVL1_28590 [Corchorus capsularis]